MSQSSRPDGRERKGGRGGVTRFVVRLALYLVACWNVVALLAGGLFPGARIAVLALALYTTLPLVVFAIWRGWPFYPRAWFRLLVVRPFWYVQLLLPIVSVAGMAGIVIGAAFGAPLAIGRALAGAVLAIGAVTLLAGYLGSRRLVVRDVEAMVPGMPSAFDGLRIVQISDLHVGPHIPRRFLARVADAVARARPDLIAVTGDLVDDRAEDVAAYERALGGLSAPMGVYTIAGNHDIYAGWELVEPRLRALAGSELLLNDARILERDGERLALLGTGDPAAGSWERSARAAPDIARALSKIPSGVTTIAFAHNPALWPALAKRGVALTLSGHTHWGQFALPRRGWSLASPFLRHAMGAHREGDSLLYVHPGTGYWGIPFRLGAYPEVTVVTLRSAAEAGVRMGAARRAA